MDALSRFRLSLEVIAKGDDLIFDEETQSEVEVAMDADTMSEIARLALNPPINNTPEIRNYLETRDNRLQAGDSCRDTHEGCERALRDVYLMSCGKRPEHGC